MATIDQLLTAVRSAELHVNDVHDDGRSLSRNREVADQNRDEAVHDERVARDNLIGWTCATYPSRGGPVALLLDDGSIVCYGTDADGLSVVRPENVHQPVAGGNGASRRPGQRRKP